MAIRTLRIDDDPVLRKPCRPIAQVDERIHTLLEDMGDTLRAAGNGAAIAACQIGVLRRAVVIDWEGELIHLVNPVILEAEGEQECLEGCLSFPGRWGRTIRPQRVRVQALNERGEPFTLEGEGLLAQCLSHELDHLDGMLFLDLTTHILTDEELKELTGEDA